MMNNARIGVGIQGLGLWNAAISRRAITRKLACKAAIITKPKDPPVTIIHHPDVRRMLLGMKAHTEAARALAYSCAFAVDARRYQRASIS